MKVYLVVYTRCDSCGTLKDRYVLKAFSDMVSVNFYMISQALGYASTDYYVSLTHSDVYIDTVHAERNDGKNLDEVVEITVEGLDVEKNQ